MIYELDPSQNLDIRPSTEDDEVRRRRFFSRGGGLAVKSIEQSEVLTAELGFSEEFGVEQQMGEYRALWGEYSDSVETFSNDEEAHQLYDEMTGFGSAEANASRSDKRKLMPRRDKDFAEVVLATALTSRVIGTSGSDAASK